MNIDRIIKLAIEAKLLHESETKEYISECGVEVWISGQRGLDALEKFATLIKDDGVINGSWLHEHIRTAINGELEACARLAEMPIGEYEVVVACGTEPAPYRIPQYANWQDIAKAIRARARDKV